MWFAGEVLGKSSVCVEGWCGESTRLAKDLGERARLKDVEARMPGRSGLMAEQDQLRGYARGRVQNMVRA